jgi:hypothetical protein
MSATSSSSDKYLFLYTTTENDNLQPVKTALQTYYKYPAAADHTFEANGRASFKTVYKSLVEKLCGTNPLSPVYALPDPAGKVPPDEDIMNTLIVIISGNSDSAATGLVDADGGILTWDEINLTIKGRFGPLNYPYQDHTEVNIIFVSPNCDSLVSVFDNNVPLLTGTLTAKNTPLGDQGARNSFLSSLADELKLSTPTVLDQYGRISFNNIAASLLGSAFSGSYRVEPNSSSNYFPGYSFFEIADSDPVGESPDINIIHPSIPGVLRTQYLYDSEGSIRNSISVHAVVRGTHPVKSLCINLGIYRILEVVPFDEPSLKANKPINGSWKPGDTITPDPVIFDTLQFLYSDYYCLIARASAVCNDTFTGTDPGGNDNEAQLNIMMYEEDLLCSVEHTDESSAGANNGSITIVATGGAPFQPPSGSYEYNIDGGSWGPNNQFNGLPGATHTVCARDSAGQTCCETVDLTAQGNTGQQCDQLLDNRYIHICRTTSGSLKCTFKPYPHLPEGYYRTRGYKIRWKPPIPHPVTPAIPPSDIIEFHDVTVVASGLDHIGGSYRPYLILRVIDNRTGEIILKYPKPGIVTDSQRVSVPVKIYFRKIFGIWPPWWWRWPWRWDWRWPWDWRLSWPWRWPYRWRWPWLWPFSWWCRIARFRLIIVPHMYDIEEY